MTDKDVSLLMHIGYIDSYTDTPRIGFIGTDSTGGTRQFDGEKWVILCDDLMFKHAMSDVMVHFEMSLRLTSLGLWVAYSDFGGVPGQALGSSPEQAVMNLARWIEPNYRP
jgi:hypothetical protein